MNIDPQDVGDRLGVSDEGSKTGLNRHRGSTLEAFLAEEGILDQATNRAVKRVIAWQLKEAMNKQQITKTDMAIRMDTSRRQLDRVLNPNDENVTLHTLERAAEALGHSLRVELA